VEWGKKRVYQGWDAFNNEKNLRKSRDKI
jgi:hypothetical protein